MHYDLKLVDAKSPMPVTNMYVLMIPPRTSNDLASLTFPNLTGFLPFRMGRTS